MDWRYPDDEQILEITERQYENVFENLPYRAKKYYRCEHHYAHYMNGVWLYGHNEV